MTDVFLVRHAPTSWSGHRYCGRSDPPLDGTGTLAATRLATTLAESLPPGIRIVSSPRKRAEETARVIAAAVGGIPIEFDTRWAETDFGIAEGLRYDELVAVAPDIAERLVHGDVEIDWPGGERAVALATRVEAAWLDLARDSTPTLVVTHGGPIRVAIACATGHPATAVPVVEPAAAVRLARTGVTGSWHVIGRA